MGKGKFLTDENINISPLMAGQGEKQKLMVENISCILPESRTMGGLYLGNTYGAQNSDILKEYGIRAVLTTSIETPIAYDPLAIPFHLRIAAHDKDDYTILSHLDQCIDFIHKHRTLTNVYVHCYAGVSRSATVVIAYLMKQYGWSLSDALEFAKSKRIVTKPNEGFMEQLKSYEGQLREEKGRSMGESTNTLQSLPLTNNNTNVFASRNGTKKHSQIPLPKILSKMGSTKQAEQKPKSMIKINGSEYQPSHFPEGNPNKNKIRPKDLPGYRHH